MNRFMQDKELLKELCTIFKFSLFLLLLLLLILLFIIKDTATNRLQSTSKRNTLLFINLKFIRKN